MKNPLRILLLLLFLSNALLAKTYYVDPVNGNNALNGLTEANAKRELSWFSYSTTFLQPGDNILLMNGTHTATGFAILALRASGTEALPITIKNYPGHAPLLQMNDNQWHAIHLGESIHHIVIDGLRIRGNASTIDLDEALNQPGSCANPTGPTNPKFNGNGITIDGRTNDALVHHITVRNCEIFECCGGGVSSLQGDYLTYENNTIYNNSWYTVYGSSGISNLNSVNFDSHSGGGYTMIIKNNVLYGNELFIPWIGPCVIYDGNGIIIDSENNATIGKPAYTGKTLIENNIVHHNGGRGIHAYNSNGIDIINNTCYQNGRCPVISDGEITVQGTPNVNVYNNIMFARDGERANYKDAASTGFASGNNLIYNAPNSRISYTTASDKVGEDPLFLNVGLNTGNFKVQNTSPAINAGNPTIFASKDYEGITRPQGGTPDIGAYESSGALSTVAFNSHMQKLSVYPNPTAGNATLRYYKNQSDPVRITVYDTLGKEVLQLWDKDASQGNRKLEITTNQWPNGMYFIRIHQNDGTENTVKLALSK